MSEGLQVFLLIYTISSTWLFLVVLYVLSKDIKAIKRKAVNWCYNFAPRYIGRTEEGYFKLNTKFVEDFEDYLKGL